MEKRLDFFKIMKNEEKLETLYAYSAAETVVDPFEKNKSKVYMNPLPIKALVRQVSFEALHWKYYGQIPVGSIEVIAEKKYKTLFRTASKIKYGQDYFETWKSSAKGFAILERTDYVIIILAKQEN